MAITIPFQQTTDRQLNQFQQALRSALQPITSLPTSQSSILTSISLAAGATTVNHGLNRTLSGWYPVRVRAQATIWDSQDSNSTPDQTLILNSSAAVVVDLVVF